MWAVGRGCGVEAQSSQDAPVVVVAGMVLTVWPGPPGDPFPSPGPAFPKPLVMMTAPGNGSLLVHESQRRLLLPAAENLD